MVLNNGATYLPNAGEGSVPQWLGVYAGTVINNHDPLGVGRLELNVPQVLGNAVSAWAVPAGTYYAIPTNGTPVSVSFLGGDPAQPIWNGPLDLNPLVQSAAGPNVTYSSSPPANPKVGDIWYESIGGVQVAPQVWTFNSGTSTYSWVSQPALGTPAIGAGQVTGTTIAAGTITAGNIAIGDANVNPYFTDLSHWTNQSNTTLTLSTSPPTPAPTSNAAQCVSTSSGAFGPAATNGFPCKAGQNIVLGFWVYSTLTSVSIGVNWFNSSGGYISSPATSFTNTASQWNNFNAVMTAPPSAATGKVYVTATATAGVQTAYFTGVTVAYPGGGNLSAGSIDGSTITGGTVTGAVVSATGSDGSNVTLTGGGSGSGSAAYISFDPPNTATHVTQNPQIWAQSTNAGLVNESEMLVLYSGESKSGSNVNAAMQLFSQNADGSVGSRVNFVTDGKSVGLGGSQPGYLPITQVDVLAKTSTNVLSFSNLTNTLWTIPSTDSVQGTTYKLITWGSGTWEANILEFQIVAWGATVGAMTVGAGNMTAGSSFAYHIEAYAMLAQTGSSGIVYGSIKLNLSIAGTSLLSGTGANMTGGFASFSSVSVANPGASNSNMAIQHKWGATNASQAIVSYGSIFERIGNF